MDGPSRTMNPACVQSSRAKASKGLGKNVQLSSSPTTRLMSENLGAHCCEWLAGKANADVEMLVEANSKPHDNVIYTGGSVTQGRSGWGSRSSRVGGLHKDSEPTESRPLV